MTLENWKASNAPRWSDVARMISEVGGERMFENRLNRLRTGQARPEEWEIKALMTLTKNEVDSYN